MKQVITFLITVIVTAIGYSQNFNYQAAVRNSAGDLVANQAIGVQIKILQGSASGTTLYTETHSTTSNTHSIISLAIGSGTTTDTFSAINWSTQNYWLEIAVDITGGTTYVVLGSSQLLSVPYANYAAQSPDDDPANEIELPVRGSTGQVLSTDGSGNYSWTNQTLGDNLGSHTATTNLQLANNWLSNDGDNEGVSIDDNGIVTTEAASAQTANFNSVGTGLGSYIEVNNEVGTRALFGSDGNGLSGGNTNDVVIGNWSDGDLTFFSNASEHMRIDNTGNVGIGKTNPNTKLNVNGAIRVDTGGVRIDGGGVTLQTHGANGTLNAAIREEYGNAGAMSFYNDSGEERIATFIDTSSDVGAFFVYGPNSSNFLVGNLSGSNDNGFIAVSGPTSSTNAGMYIDANGQGVIYGDIKNFRMDHPKDASKEIWYASLEGPEAGAYMRGTAKLVNGKAVIKFSEHYQETVNGTTLTLYLTPHSADSKGLSVISKGQNSFTVKELMKGKGSYTFDWVAFGERKGFEDYQVVRKKSQSPILKGSQKSSSISSLPTRARTQTKKVTPLVRNTPVQALTIEENQEIKQLKLEVATLKKLVEDLMKTK